MHDRCSNSLICMRHIINFLDYCFYRACCFHKRHPFFFSDFVLGASTFMGVTHLFHIMSLSLIWSAVTGLECNAAYPAIIGILLCFYYDHYVYTEERYKRLVKKYKNEKNKKIKGWGVVLYVIISMSTFFILIMLFRGKVNICIPEWMKFFSLSNMRLNL